MAMTQSTMRAAASYDALSPGALAAWEASFFSTLPVHIHDEILSSAYEHDLAPGDTIQVQEPILAVVAEGLIRVNVKSPEDRQVTIHYSCPCDVMGLPSIIAPARVAAQRLSLTAMRPSKLVHVLPREFRSLVAGHAATAFRVCELIVGDLLVGQSMLAENLFLPVRQRVARHLLDLAEREGRTWVVHATQQDLADAIGSVREVVSRALTQLRDEGLICRVPEGLAIADTAGLHRESKGYVW